MSPVSRTSPGFPAWLPSDGVQVLPCHRWWDVVRVSSFYGSCAMRRLESRTGPVVEDQARRAFHWFVAVGAADGWGLPHVEVLGAGCTLRVPPVGWTMGPAVRWLVPVPVNGNVLTRPQRLHDVLAGLLPGRRFPDPVRPLRRCGCGALLVDPQPHACPPAAR